MTEYDLEGAYTEPVAPVPQSPEVARHFARQRRRAMCKMAIACGIDPAGFNQATPEGEMALWAKISEHIAGGVATTQENIIGDPFVVALIGICDRPHGPDGVKYEQTAMVKTGSRVDQAEGERILAFLKGQADVHTCEQCGGLIENWQSDNTRFSTFKATWSDRTKGQAVAFQRHQDLS